MTWFKADPEIRWFDTGTEVEEICKAMNLTTENTE
jgi:hypothetical protein